MSTHQLRTVTPGRVVRLTRAELAALRDLRELRGQPREAAPPPPPEPEAMHATRTLGQQLREGPAPAPPRSLRGQLRQHRQGARVRTAAQPPAVSDTPAADGSEPETIPATSMAEQFRRLRGGRK